MTIAETTPKWTFLSNHSHVLICLAKDPEMRMRDVAEQVGITERAVQRIVLDLEECGALERRKVGRRNRYTINPQTKFRHPLESHATLSVIIDGLADGPAKKGAGRKGT